ncbi:FecR family protein [Sphingomonas qilianensis]|uniref:FecR domain-containing protein n=1 Tax=Sphingomonas qilianensis TaxID=1736690 RepID=A0ABU9XSS6_9SPHN
MSFRRGPENTNRQAAEWLARLHADDRTPDDETAFRAWLNADPHHAAAFERASTIWESVGGLGVLPATSTPHVSRRTVLASAATIVVAGGAGFGWREAVAGVYQTDVGEQRRLLLEDGTRVMLDTATRFRFRPHANTRILSLSNGRIDLNVAKDARPFLIEAGAQRASLPAGHVDVRRDGARVAFTAIEGTPQILAGGATLALESGHRMVMTDGRTDRVDRPDLQDLIAWQDGRLAFRDEMLSQAVAEMNRYTNRPLVVADAQVGGLRLSGMYRVGDPEAFARSIAILLPVRVQADAKSVRIFHMA